MSRNPDATTFRASVGIVLALTAIVLAAPKTANAQQSSAVVVAACGTPPATYPAGTTRALTQDTNGKLCDSGGGGGGGPSSVNLTQVGGTAVDVNVGPATAGTQRTVTADGAVPTGSPFTATTNGVFFDTGQSAAALGYGSITASFSSVGSGGVITFYGTDDTTTAAASVTTIYSLALQVVNGTGSAIGGASRGSLSIANAIQVSTRGYPRIIAKFTGIVSGTYTASVHMAKDPNDLRSTFATVPVVNASTTRTNGTITVANTFQSVLASASTRQGCLITNTSANAMTVDLGASPAAATAIPLPAGASFNCATPAAVVITDQVNLTSSTIASTFVVWAQ